MDNKPKNLESKSRAISSGVQYQPESKQYDGYLLPGPDGKPLRTYAKVDYSSLYGLNTQNTTEQFVGQTPRTSVSGGVFIDGNTIIAGSIRTQDRKTEYNLDEGYRKVSDDDNTRIYESGEDGFLKASLPGFDADTTGNENLAFSTEFVQMANDWIEFSTQAGATYSTANRITFSGYDPSKRMSPGTRIRFKQGGGYKYMYVLWSRATYIEVLGGSTYSVANSAITDFAVSGNFKPADFPVLLPYTETWEKNSGGGTFTFPAAAVNTRGSGFSMNGNTITASGYIEGVTYSTSGAASVRVTLPTADFVYGDVDNSGVIDLSDFSIALANAPVSVSNFIDIISNSEWATSYTDDSASPIYMPGTMLFSEKASGSDAYLSAPSKVKVIPHVDLTSGVDYGFSFEVTYLIEYYGS